MKRKPLETKSKKHLGLFGKYTGNKKKTKYSTQRCRKREKGAIAPLMGTLTLFQSRGRVKGSNKNFLTLIGMRQGGFTHLIIFGLDFVS